MRLLCGEDLFLKVYDRRIQTSGVVNIPQRLREIKRVLESTSPCEHLTDHR